jgi:hypothetical protein
MATVDRVDVVGEDAHVYLRVGGQSVQALRVVARVPTSGRPAAGDEVGLMVRWSDAHAFDTATGERVTGP